MSTDGHSGHTRRRFLTGAGAGAGIALAGCASLIGDDSGFTEDLDPPGLMLSWQRDPTTTMTIDWHTPKEEDRYAEEDQDPELEYRGADDEEWERVTGDTRVVEHEDPTTTYDREIHRVELTELEPASTYEFRVGAAPIWEFETMPSDLDEPLTFASGGDTGHTMFDSVLEALIEHDPAFLTICGDLPIADGGTASGPGRMWESWFESVKDYLVDGTDRVIPVVAGIGNHECRNGYVQDARHFPYEDTDEWREWFAPYFYAFFAFPGHPGYGVLDFGDYLSIPMLDTDHTNPIRGQQTEWLENVLEEREDVPYVFPNYHVPVYPCYTPQQSWGIPMHNAWPPRFDAYDIEFAFEHHIHVYKRSPPIKDDEPHPEGVIYMGDGNLGQMAPSAVDETNWWIDDASQSYNFHLLTIDSETTEITTYDEDNELLGEIEREVSRV